MAKSGIKVAGVTAPAEELQIQLDAERRLVSFDSYDMTVRQIFEMFDESAIFVPDEYQRQFVWDEARESELIESIFLGIPVPSLFMATNKDSTWEIVDGVQRLSSIAHFITDGEQVLNRITRKAPLVIQELEKLSKLNNHTFSSLPKALQLLFMTRPVRVTVLNDKSDLNVRFDLFERLNTGGVLLTNQEIRNCIFRGAFNDSLKKVVGFEDFLRVVKLRESDAKNGTAEEFALRFFAFLDRYQQFEKSVKGFLNDYMKENSAKAIPPKRLSLLKKVFAVLRAAFPEGINRGVTRTTPVNLFEALSVGVALALNGGKEPDIKKLHNIVDDPTLKRLTTGATNSNKMVRGRIEYVRDNI